MTRSPWERALGSRRTTLDPQLATYFSTIPEGSVGQGHGVFTVVGTPRRWLWPALALLAIQGIAFPVFQRDVPFTVTNRSTPAGTVRAERSFHFAEGPRIMRDEIGIGRNGLVDRLGNRGTLETTLDADVVDGALSLRSRAAAVRLGKWRLPLGPLSPRVVLLERADSGKQYVSLSVAIPVIGIVYEYAGHFTYAIREES